MAKLCGRGCWEWRGAGMGHGRLCASSLQADCKGALSKAGADLPCLASRLSCVKLVTLSFPQISTGYWDDIVLACSLRKAAALWNQLRQFGPSFHLLTPHTHSKVWPWFHGPEMSKNQSRVITASAWGKSPAPHPQAVSTGWARRLSKRGVLGEWFSSHPGEDCRQAEPSTSSWFMGEIANVVWGVFYICTPLTLSLLCTWICPS